MSNYLKYLPFTLPFVASGIVFLFSADIQQYVLSNSSDLTSKKEFAKIPLKEKYEYIKQNKDNFIKFDFEYDPGLPVIKQLAERYSIPAAAETIQVSKDETKVKETLPLLTQGLPKLDTRHSNIEVVPQSLKLEMIIEEDGIVIVNNKIVAIGEEYDGYKLKNIKRGRACFIKNKEQVCLRMH